MSELVYVLTVIKYFGIGTLTGVAEAKLGWMLWPVIFALAFLAMCYGNPLDSVLDWLNGLATSALDEAERMLGAQAGAVLRAIRSAINEALSAVEAVFNKLGLNFSKTMRAVLLVLLFLIVLRMFL